MLRLALGLVVCGYLVFIGLQYRAGYAAAARGEAPLFTDFTSLYGAALQLRSGTAEDLYRPREAHRWQLAGADAAYGGALSEQQIRRVGYSAWLYPPLFMVYALPLAFLPYLASLVTWLALTAIPYLAALRNILRPAPGLLFGLAAPPAFFNLMFGQTGFLSAGLIALGLTRLVQNPVAAGVCIGLASFKPHLGVLVPLALAAGGQWRAFVAAAASVLALALASVTLFGDGPWFGFAASVMFAFDGFDAGAYTWKSMTSVLSALHLAGLDLKRAWRLQVLVMVLVSAAVVYAWWAGRRRPQALGLQSALLCTATPLVIPMVYLYDLALLVPGAAWIWADLRRRGATLREYALVVVALAALLPAMPLAAATGLQVGALCAAALFGLALYRWRGLAGEPAAGT